MQTDVDEFYNATQEFQDKYGFELDLADPNEDMNEQEEDEDYSNQDEHDQDDNDVQEPIQSQQRTVARTLSPTQQRIQQSTPSQQQQRNPNLQTIQDRLAAARERKTR